MLFSEIDGLAKHKKNSAVVEPYKCENCKNAFSDSHRWEPYECNICKNIFGSKYRYGKLNHLSIKCYICGNTFKKIVTWIITLEN